MVIGIQLLLITLISKQECTDYLKLIPIVNVFHVEDTKEQMLFLVECGIYSYLKQLDKIGNLVAAKLKRRIPVTNLKLFKKIDNLILYTIKPR